MRKKKCISANIFSSFLYFCQLTKVLVKTLISALIFLILKMQAPLDFKTIEPISYKQTVAVINSFVIGTTDYLNKFSFWCEKKLMEVSRNIERLEITMNILEAKLASIEGTSLSHSSRR